MATFNAGSIEATLDLDRDPFQRGLSEARGEGRRFAQETFTATLEVDAGEARSDLAVLRREFERVAQTYTARVEIDGIAKSAAEVEALNAQLERLGGDTRNTRGLDIGGSAAGIAATRRGVRGLIPLLAIAATGLVPLTAAAVPILGLANNLTLVGAAAGGAFLAVQGVGGALKAANAAGVEPTAQNLAKLHATMANLHPEARAFIADLRGMSDEYHDLQRAAAGGFFPGVRRGLADVDLEDYRGLVRELGGIAGDTIERTLSALDDPRWRQFFRFVKGEARPGVDALASSVGNLAGFFASLWQAFDPLNDDFSRWLVNSTRDMRAWADALPDDPAFQDFIAYVREQGPHAAAALGAIVNAFIDVVQAAAPLGGVVLDTLTVVAHLISDIADSPFGPSIIAGLSAIYTLNKALAITEGLMVRAGLAKAPGKGPGGATPKPGAALGAMITPIPAKVSESYRGFIADTKALWTARAGIDKTGEAAERMKGRLANLGKGGAALAGIGLIATGTADKMGLTNTATLAMAGSIVGPWGTAIGAGVGLMMDWANANKASAEQTEANKRAIDGMIGSANLAGLRQASDNAVSVRHAAAGSMFADDINAATQPAFEGFDRMQTVLNKFNQGLTGNDGTTSNLGKLEAIVNRMGPAMTRFGYSFNDLADMDSGELEVAIDRMTTWTKRTDSASGRTKAFAGTVRDLGNEALSTADSAAAMSSALEALLGPALSNEAALDKWHASLKALEKDLKAGAGFQGYGAAAMKNREITRQYASDSIDRLKALAGVSTTTERDMANAVNRTRSEFIKSGIAAGFSRKEIVRRANALGLTPKLVRTVFEAAGIDKADLAARSLRGAYNAIPKKVQARIGADGIPKTMADVNELVKRYDLTEKQRTAILTLRDLATSQLINANRMLDKLNGKTATTYVRTIRTGPGGTGNDHGFAYGGPVYGPGTGTSDSIPAWLSNGEHVWTAREVANAGGHAAVEALREQFRFAAGGIADWSRVQTANMSDRSARVATRATIRATRPGLSSSDVDRIVAAIEANRGVYAHVTSREDVELALRALEHELRLGKV